MLRYIISDELDNLDNEKLLQIIIGIIWLIVKVVLQIKRWNHFFN